MKRKILMLVGVAVSVIFLSTSAFAVLTLATEKIDRGYYIEVVIKVQNDGSASYPQKVGIQTIRKRIDSEVHTSEILGYDELDNPVLMRDTGELLGEEGDTLFSNNTRIEMDAPIYAEGRMRINGRKYITIQGVEQERINFENEYNLQGVKTNWTELRWMPDPGNPGEFRQVEYTETALLTMEGPFYYPSEPLYKLYAVGGNGTVELGRIFVPKPEGSEILPVFVFDIYITDDAAAPLIDFEVNPNVP